MVFFRLAIVIILSIATVLTSAAQVAFPLKASADQRYLVDQQNTPFPILGRTAWCIISAPEAGYKSFLGNTLAHGHNAIEMAVICHWPAGNHSPVNGRGDQPFLRSLDGSPWNGKLIFKEIATEGPDFTTPNEAYWKYADELLAYCELKGIFVLLFPAYLGYDGGDQGWMQELVANGPKKMEAYGAWIAKRYAKRSNILWMILGDYGKLNATQRDAEAALIKGLKSVQGKSVQFSAESFSGQNAAENACFGQEMTMNGSYAWEQKNPVPLIARRAYAHMPVLPSFLLEEPYDEEGPDGTNFNVSATQPVRRFQWWGWLSTIGGYVSGNGNIWPFIAPLWQQHVNTQAALDMSRLNAFVRSVDWWKLVPSGLNGMRVLIPDSANNSADTLGRYVSAAAAADSSFLIAYIPPAVKGGVTIDLRALKPRLTAEWYDPTTGGRTGIPGGGLSNNAVNTFLPPRQNSRGETDWVLLVRATD